VIFKNTKNEITESAFNNIFIEDDSGMLFTPHLSSGLLNGILRQNLILSKKASEKVIYGKDIFGAKNVFLGNSLRGLVKIDILADF
jgi:4-amino-4-deoxychorismate lyase